jgi:acyl transferase domain-containing protein/NAD(P)H-dependent flavin oxidoreductase YrpB (nitropropane dioxygenase family)/NAD(P)-dependent dehydrogenase (short-subunit alcohol dehydrogenase family)
MDKFQIITLSPPGFPNPGIAIAGCRAGGIGVLDLAYCPHGSAAHESLEFLARKTGNAFGVKLNGYDRTHLTEITSHHPENLQFVLLGGTDPKKIKQVLKTLSRQGLQVWLECTSLAEARMAEAAGVAGVIAKGHEAGGRVAQETTFILLQQFLQNLVIPVWAQGGIGLHTASACYAAGAAGVVLDSQLTLTKESPLPEAIKARLANLDGSETRCLGEAVGEPYRFCARLGTPVIKELEEIDQELSREGTRPREALGKWRRAIQARVGWHSPDRHLFLFGQDIGFAAPLSHKFETVGGILEALRNAIRDNCRVAAAKRPLAAASPLARSHGTRYPIVQGPMARVSDNPTFIEMVAQGGALPFVAAAWMRAPELDTILHNTAAGLKSQPWGVGLLGFLPREVYLEQIKVILKYRPGFALIAGGQTHQVKQLEQEGIATYVHVPSPGLLRMFLNEGLTRFVFEGRESGGHVGPLCSFVLFETMITALLESPGVNQAPGNYHILFAGGIHDALSASMVGLLAGQLVEKGLKVGLQVGTAYLFTDAAVASGAIVSTYQQEALQCRATTLLISSPGHAERVIETPFVQVFKHQKWLRSEAGATPEALRHALDQIKLGRLRIATKGIVRNPDHQSDPQAPPFINLSESEQREQGIYLAGQVAAMRGQVATIEALHQDLSVQATARLDKIWQAWCEDYPDPGEAPPADIAIVGMACLLPRAATLQALWENILNKVNAIQEVPPERWDWRLYYDQDRDAGDKICSRWGGFLDDIPFDPAAYGMPPNSLASIEPLQLLALEVTKRAVEDAGYAKRPFCRERTAVVFGISGSGELAQLYSLRTALPTFFGDQSREILTHFDRVLPTWTEDTFPGILMNVTAGRIANRFNLGGANCTVDAACASSLAAVYWAVRELETRACDMAIVGGADCMQNPFTYMCFAKTQALSPRGSSKPLDESADGIVLGEGIAVMVLKRLADAERAGDRIYAVIKGVGASSDGREKSLSAPNREGQVRALKRAYAKAGVSPAAVGLIEAHATGTTVGDRIEIESLSQVFTEARAESQGCAIGSIKSMIGHTKSTAGLASLIKATLALHHKVLPPTLGVEQPNSALLLPDTPFSVNNEARPWLNPRENQPRRAGVSAFGFGGTNFHVVLEEYTGNYLDHHGRASFQDWPSELFFWERSSRQELLEAIGSLEASLASLATPFLGELAFRRFKDQQREPAKTATAWRLAVVASGVLDLQGKLAKVRSVLSNPDPTGFDPAGIYLSERSQAATGKVAFLFPGQGTQYINMLADLAMQFPEIRVWFEHSDQLLADQFLRPMTAYIYPPSAFTKAEKFSRKAALADTRVAQPALGAVDLALFNLLNALGIKPDMVAGHSYGEYVALSAAGVLAPDDLITLSEARARFIAAAAGAHPGTMAAINADVDTVAGLIEKVEGVWVANINAPQQTVISGTQPGVEAAVEIFRHQGLQARIIPVSCAFHSPLVSPAAEALENYLLSLKLRAPQVTVFSNTTAGPYPADPVAITRQLVEHLASRVEFRREIVSMYEAGARTFVEVGPGRVLTGLVGQILGERPHLAVATNQAGRSGLVSLLNAVAQLMAHGVSVSLEKIFQGRSLHRLEAETLEQDRKYTSSTWMVNGARARPLHEFDASHAGSGITPFQFGDVQKMGTPAATPRGVTVETPVSNQPDKVMGQYQRLMQRFLETQKAVMLKYLETAGQAEIPVKAAIQPSAADFRPSREAPPPWPPGQEPDHCRPELADQAPIEAAAVATLVEATIQIPVDREELASTLLKIVSNRTGYPPEMLGLDLDLEADLGIDSIKRTEIIGHFLQTIFPPEDGRSPKALIEFSSVNTLGGIIEQVGAAGIRVNPNPPEIPAPAEPSGSPTSLPACPAGNILPRFTLAAVPAPAPTGSLRLAPGRVVMITDDGRGVAAALAEKLHQAGLETALIQLNGGATAPTAGYRLPDLTAASLAHGVATIRRERGPIGALVHLLPLRQWLPYDDLDLAGWQTRLQEDIVSLFHLLQLVAADLKNAAAAGGAWMVAASGLGGLFASDPLQPDDFFPGQGGIAGVLKTVALEWPGVNVKCVDLGLAEAPATLADHLLVEIKAQDGLVEVGYHQGCRMMLNLRETPLPSRPPNELNLDSSSIILVTGGARGITASVSREIARKYRPTLIVVGRAPLPPEPEDAETAGLAQPQELKAALVEKRRRQGQPFNLTEVEEVYRNLLQEREIRGNLAALRAGGAQVSYFPVDVRDPVALGELLDQIYSRHGRLDGVVHGAGIIEDKLLQDKSRDSFDRVFGIKTESAFILSKKLRPETLKFLVLFSSVAGRFGSRGQADYTAANEVYNKLAAYLDRQWPGRVLAINWGPWKTAGMVSVEVQRQFEARGIALIEPAAGARTFDLELHRGRKGEGEVVIGDGPWREPALANLPDADRGPSLPLLQGLTTCQKTNGHLEIVRRLTPDHDLYLHDHRLDLKPVLPAAMAIEFMAEAAQQHSPEWRVAGLKGVRVYKGIVLDDPCRDLRIIVDLPGSLSLSPETLELEVAIQGASPTEPICYRGTVVMSRKAPLPEPYRLPVEADFQDFGLSAAAAYRKYTFHGPRFQGIRSIRGISEKGMIATVAPSMPISCLAGEPLGQWIIDPVALDCGLQLALLWGRTYLDITPLPSSFKEIWLYQPFNAVEVLHCYYEVLREFGRQTVYANIYFFDPDGRLFGIIKEFESTGSKALNRLAGSHLGREDLSSHNKGIGLDG